MVPSSHPSRLGREGRAGALGVQGNTTQPWQLYPSRVPGAREFQETRNSLHPLPRAETTSQKVRRKEGDRGSHPRAPLMPQQPAVYPAAETAGARGWGRQGWRGSQRRLLNPAGSSPSFPSKAKFPPWARGQVSPTAPTSCLVWGLHPPACQHATNLAQLSGPWIPRPGLQPTPLRQGGREGIPEQTVGPCQRLHSGVQCTKRGEQQPAAVTGQKPLGGPRPPGGLFQASSFLQSAQEARGPEAPGLEESPCLLLSRMEVAAARASPSKDQGESHSSGFC